MERRDFGKLALVAAASGLASCSPGGAEEKKPATQSSFEGLGRPPRKWALRHALQIEDLEPETLQLAKQLGMDWVKFGPLPNEDPETYREAARKVETAGLKVAKIHSRVHCSAEIVLNLPGRDQQIEAFKQHLRAVAALGIKHHLYAHMANSVWRTPDEYNRGNAICQAFDEAKPAVARGTRTPTFEREYAEDELWSNWEYFCRQIKPVAEETGVHIGVHPDDPPGLPMGRIPRPIFSSFEGYKRAIEIADSPNIGMGLCVGTWLEGGSRMGRNVLDTIEYFGSRKKLFVIHFRNVNGTLPHFHETYLNEGYMDMYKVMRALRKVNFEGVLVGDHFPQMVKSAGRFGGQIYTIGYLQALIERADEEAQAAAEA